MSPAPDNQHQYNTDDEDQNAIKGVKVLRGEELITRLKEVRGVASFSTNRPSGLARKISDLNIKYQNRESEEEEDPQKKIKIIAIALLVIAFFYLMF